MHLLAFAEAIQLFPDGTLFIHVAMILAMIWILNRTLYRPINRIIDAREKSKGGHAGEAAEILKSVEEKEGKYAREMLDARSRGYSLVEKEQKKAAEAREKKIVDAKAETAVKLDTEKAELENQVIEARRAISANAGKMADKIAESILRG